VGILRGKNGNIKEIKEKLRKSKVVSKIVLEDNRERESGNT